MVWFYYFMIIIVLLFPNTKIVATSSIGNQLAAAEAARDGNGNGNGNGGMDKSCFHNEKQALLNFKASLQDPHGQLSTWRAEDDNCCKWSGVICNNQTPHVTELYLSLNELGGEISPSFLNLTYLHHLDLSSNSFLVTIPDFIGSMTRLRYLNLGYNSFNGIIPKSIGSLTQLRYLNLSNNFLHGTVPPEFGNLTSLQNLSLGPLEGCMIENIDWLSNLSNLQHLEMEKISLAKANYWIDVILSLPKLSFLSLFDCDLSEVMHPYSSFVKYSSSSIGFLSLRNNNLNSSMYGWLFPLTSKRLLSLDLSCNMLDGIPKYLGNLCSLTSLTLHNNSVDVKLPSFLSNLSACTLVTLRELSVSGSQFTGSLSDEIQNFSSLKRLNLSHNHLNGTMSDKVWQLPNLQILDVSSNSLAGGVISENIGKSKVWHIDLSNNSLEVVPSKARMLNLSYVKYLDMSACNLGPLFPKWIQTHKNLTYLDISNNRISNIIPAKFWKIWPSQLTYLNLSSNNISGKVLDLSSNFDLYPRIDLSTNHFFGPIPNVLPTLVSLNLSRNKFYGGISFLCQIVGGFLSFIDLSHNSLTGHLPDCLWHFKELRVLNLGHNKLSGRLPASIGHAIHLEVLQLYNNSFLGELPLSLKNCTDLKFLNLGANRFLGNVPVWLGENLTGLYGLSLRSNNFFGPIPLQLCRLLNLQILDLSINNLNGTIPSCVNNLNAMVQGSFLRSQHIHRFGLAHYKKGDITTIISYIGNMMIEWGGTERDFIRYLDFWTSIDFSSNKLTGQIPDELTDLHELVALNLSRNALLGGIPQKIAELENLFSLDLSINNFSGGIPQKIGELKKLLALDLSRNNFSGGIPSSMSQLTFLSYLDMSYNSLSGRIPSGTQLQSFDLSTYTGNVGLCGGPFTKSCPGDEVPSVAGGSESESGEEGTDELETWFYVGGATGFAIGFWMAFGALLLNDYGKHAFFPLVDFVKDWVYVKVAVFIRKLERVAHE